jgi:anti-anti-sigma factor
MTQGVMEVAHMRVWANDSADLVVIVGHLEVATVPDARAVLHEAVDRGCGDLVVDLREVELVDATGLGVLVGTHRRAQRVGRRLVLRGVPPRINRLLTLTRLHRVIPTEPVEPLPAV